MPFKHKKNPSSSEGRETWEQVSQRSCGVFIPGHIQNPTGQGLEQPALGVPPALSTGV